MAQKGLVTWKLPIVEGRDSLSLEHRAICRGEEAGCRSSHIRQTLRLHMAQALHLLALFAYQTYMTMLSSLCTKLYSSSASATLASYNIRGCLIGSADFSVADQHQQTATCGAGQMLSKEVHKLCNMVECNHKHSEHDSQAGVQITSMRAPRTEAASARRPNWVSA